MVVDMIVNKLNELIFDEDKLITYALLSKEFGVHVNVSKQILSDFWQNNNAETGITAMFAIMGQLIDGSERIEIVEKSALNSTKEKYKKIYTEHIYSLQKTVPNLQILELLELPRTQFTSINCKESFIKVADDCVKSQPLTKLLDEKKISFEQKNVEKTEKCSNSKVSEQKNVEATNAKKEKAIETTAVKEKKKGSEKMPKKSVQSIEAGFKNMFGKCSNLNSKPAPKEVEKSEKITHVKEEKDNESEEETKVIVEKKESPVKLKKKQPSKKEKVNSGKSNKGKKKLVHEVKKRKRIISESESSEDSAASSDFEENTKENTEAMEYAEELSKSKSSPELNSKSGKRMVKTTEDMCSLDSDGFLVTKKVIVSTEVKEDAVADEPSPPKMSCKEPNANKTKKKQLTLTSFFKKK